MSSARYWVRNEYDGSEIVIAYERPDVGSDWSGPFKTLAEAKKEAIEYHKATVEHARYNIYKIKTTKLEDIEPYLLNKYK
jgi:hypothetical protein